MIKSVKPDLSITIEKSLPFNEINKKKYDSPRIREINKKKYDSPRIREINKKKYDSPRMCEICKRISTCLYTKNKCIPPVLHVYQCKECSEKYNKKSVVLHS